jgi:hypothetical protein
MFGRSVKLSLEKDPKGAPKEEAVQIDQAAAYSALISTTVENVGRTILSGILVVIAAQTAREVIVKRTKER